MNLFSKHEVLKNRNANSPSHTNFKACAWILGVSLFLFSFHIHATCLNEKNLTLKMSAKILPATGVGGEALSLDLSNKVNECTGAPVAQVLQGKNGNLAQYTIEVSNYSLKREAHFNFVLELTPRDPNLPTLVFVIKESSIQPVLNAIRTTNSPVLDLGFVEFQYVHVPSQATGVYSSLADTESFDLYVQKQMPMDTQFVITKFSAEASATDVAVKTARKGRLVFSEQMQSLANVGSQAVLDSIKAIYNKN